MERLSIILFLCSLHFLNAQSSFKRENEFIEYAKKNEMLEEQSSVLLFIQNQLCVQGCDPYVPYKVNALVQSFPKVKFYIIHTLDGDTLFGDKSQLAQRDNVKIFCDKKAEFRKYGLDFILHKFFIIQNNKIAVWNNFETHMLKKIKKEIKQYHKKGII